MGIPDGLEQLIEDLDLDVAEDEMEELEELDLSEKELDEIPGKFFCKQGRKEGRKAGRNE